MQQIATTLLFTSLVVKSALRTTLRAMTAQPCSQLMVLTIAIMAKAIITAHMRRLAAMLNSQSMVNTTNAIAVVMPQNALNYCLVLVAKSATKSSSTKTAHNSSNLMVSTTAPMTLPMTTALVKFNIVMLHSP
jgi:hypothetical protein